MREFLFQLFEVPGSELGGLVICQAEGLDLAFRDVIGDDTRNSGQPEFLARLEPCVAGNDDVILGNDNRNLEPEFLYAVRDGVDGSLVISWVVLVLE
jgi:hypothetical protein